MATFLPFPAPPFSFLLFLFCDLFSSFRLLADCSHPCFSNCPYIVGSLTSKLPSTTTATTGTDFFQHNNNYERHCNYNYNYTTTTLHYATPLLACQKAHFQSPFGPSVGSLCNPRVITTHVSYCFLSCHRLARYYRWFASVRNHFSWGKH